MFFSGYNNKDYWQSFPTVTIAKVKINFNSQSKKYMFDTTIDNIRHKIAKIVSFFIINYTRRPYPTHRARNFRACIALPIDFSLVYSTANAHLFSSVIYIYIT